MTGITALRRTALILLFAVAKGACHGPEKADAKYENGVLELTLPKKEGGATGHQLAVH